MIEKLASIFVQTFEENDAVNLVRCARTSGFHHINLYICPYLFIKFPYSYEILNEWSVSAYYAKKYDLSYQICHIILFFKNLNETDSKRIIFNQHFSISSISNNYTSYNYQKINTITKNCSPGGPSFDKFNYITFTITSCKRFDLFQNTINSFINCCRDSHLISKWICIDDNSSETDRQKMKELYPFFDFYFKTPEEKGHPKSMNIIRKLVTTPFYFHMEDDWTFFAEKNYMTDCLEVLSQDYRIGQCLINKNYGEVASDINIIGGDFKTTKTGNRYYIHEYVNSEELRHKFHSKHGAGPTCHYWPHFSFRPSLLRTRILTEIGDFHENIAHFERNYSDRYFKKGFISAFLENIYSIHTGRLTSQIHDTTKLNAYDLNGEAQFDKTPRLDINKSESPQEPTPEEQPHVPTRESPSESSQELIQKQISLSDFNMNFKSYVINLDNRPDRYEKFLKDSTPGLDFLKIERFSAVDGNKLQSTPQLQRLFDGNDYNMRKGMVGVTLSHMKLYINLLESDCDAFLIFEDDLEFTPNFDKKLLHLYKHIQHLNWDIVYLGHHLYVQVPQAYDKIEMPTIEQWNAKTSLSKSMGGIGGYFISKDGARKLMQFINERGMTNGIDTMQQKAADCMNIFYVSPHLFYSNCYRGDRNVDSDIQYNFQSLTVPLHQRLADEIQHYGTLTHIQTFETAFTMVVDVNIQNNFYYEGIPHDIKILKESCLHPFFMLAKSIIIVIPNSKNKFELLKDENGNFNINNMLIFSS